MEGSSTLEEADDAKAAMFNAESGGCSNTLTSTDP